MFRTLLGCTLALISLAANTAPRSPYVDQEAREIKAFSAEEISGYLAGKGLGLAKAAELNGFPGPAHVLELAVQLDLTTEQKINTEALFSKMQTRAIPLGKELIEEERALDRLFALRAVNSESLGQSLARIGRLQSELRQVHLDAHIEQTALLAPHQVEKYNRLRGYAMTAGQQTHEARHH